ncbi:uncharacterized protein K452DRAFT_306720 [Aplosporella prunicola CBS 121167]|uniref:Protein transport protein Sec61 subunit beta n=1 Tax=Aplosporella prunicola CBS 121167 TaxID=1176127 RepID=A0A6A6BKB8_9PEZI|nr:uncharacterized protein K452DRAFT_306720 [Aplosporella prunicola CBS 121167]KAF2144088.1 hypothetical protein K452DRAFT_306720 [Aplosporella prunicola CBS 121167]
MQFEKQHLAQQHSPSHCAPAGHSNTSRSQPAHHKHTRRALRPSTPSQSPFTPPLSGTAPIAHTHSVPAANSSVTQSSPRPTSPVNSPPATGSSTARPSSPKPPGGPATAIRRKAAADRADKVANARPSSTRAAGAGGSSSTMLRLYTDESPGLKVDPVVVLVLSVGFIISVVALHVIAKLTKKFSA